MMTRRSVILSIALVCLAGALAHAEQKAKRGPKALIVGTWQRDGKKDGTVEFKADGTLSATGKRKGTVAGTYTWIDDATLDVTLTMGTDTKTERLKITIDDTKLGTTDSRGKVENFVRVKP